MAEKPSKGLLHRIRDKAADKLGEQAGDWLLEALKWMAKWLVARTDFPSADRIVHLAHATFEFELT
jgi:hypothetical protein